MFTEIAQEERRAPADRSPISREDPARGGPHSGGAPGNDIFGRVGVGLCRAPPPASSPRGCPGHRGWSLEVARSPARWTGRWRGRAPGPMRRGSWPASLYRLCRLDYESSAEGGMRPNSLAQRGYSAGVGRLPPDCPRKPDHRCGSLPKLPTQSKTPRRRDRYVQFPQYPCGCRRGDDSAGRMNSERRDSETEIPASIGPILRSAIPPAIRDPHGPTLGGWSSQGASSRPHYRQDHSAATIPPCSF